MSENTVKAIEVAAEENVSKTLSIDYVLAQIEKIVENTAYIEAALGSLASVESVSPGDIGAEEKAKGLEKSAFGVVGIETALPILYTYLVKPGILTLEKLVELLVINPRKRFGIELGCDYSIWDLNEEYTVDPAEFVSMGKATPFEGWKVNGRCLATVCDGKIVYKK